MRSVLCVLCVKLLFSFDFSLSSLLFYGSANKILKSRILFPVGPVIIVSPNRAK
jgi:hypothetical protein